MKKHAKHPTAESIGAYRIEEFLNDKCAICHAEQTAGIYSGVHKTIEDHAGNHKAIWVCDKCYFGI